MANVAPALGAENVVDLRLRRVDRAVSSSPRNIGKPRQLTLAFEGGRQLIMVATDQLHGIVFLRNLTEFQPKIVLDLRIAPHFAFTAVSNDLVTEAIELICEYYIGQPVSFHNFDPNLLNNNLPQICDDLVKELITKGSMLGPVMILVQHSADAKVIGPYISGAMARAEGGNWKLDLIE